MICDTPALSTSQEWSRARSRRFALPTPLPQPLSPPLESWWSLEPLLSTDYTYSDIMTYGSNLPTLLSYSLSSIPPGRIAGTPRRVPPGPDSLLMAAMISAKSFPYQTLPTLSSFRTSLHAHATTDNTLYQPSWSTSESPLTLAAIATRHHPINCPSNPPIDLLLYAISGYFRQRVELLHLPSLSWTIYDTAQATHRTTAPLSLIQEHDIIYATCTTHQTSANLPLTTQPLALLPYDPPNQDFPPLPPDHLNATMMYDYIESDPTDLFDITLHGTKGHLTISTFNTSGLVIEAKDKLTPILTFLTTQNIDILCLQDTRTSHYDRQHIARTIKSRLGEATKCFFSDCFPTSTFHTSSVRPKQHRPQGCGRKTLARAAQTSPLSPPISPYPHKRPKIGGQLIIVSPLWARTAYDNIVDPSHLGLFAGVYIRLPQSTLLILSVYLPPRLKETLAPTQKACGPDSNTTSRQLMNIPRLLYSGSNIRS